MTAGTRRPSTEDPRSEARDETAAGRWTSLTAGAAVLVVVAATTATTLISASVDISLSTLPFAAVGVVLVWRRRGEVIGAVLLAFAVLWSVTFLATALALSAPTVEVAVVAGWLSEWTWFPAIMSVFVVLPILFPTGRAPGLWWRAVLWLALGVVAAFVVTTTFQARFSPDDLHVVDNPWGVLTLADAETLFFPFVIPLLALGPVAAVMRYRRSTGIEREQIRWFMYAAVATAVVFFWINADIEFFGINAVEALGGRQGETIVVILALSLPPLGIWIAIARHQLYDLDRLVSRTVSYALVTTLLVGLYVGSVFFLGILLPVAGDLPVAVSILLVAAIFNPLRRRVQNVVDRRFNRSRYDAIHTLEHFSQRLRHETELTALRTDLAASVSRTVEPAHLSVWLRDRR